MSFTKIMSERELRATLTAYGLGIGPYIIDYRIIPGYSYQYNEVSVEDDPLSEWENLIHKSMKYGNWYSVTMEELYPISPNGIITYRDILVKYCDKLIEHGIYHMDIHSDNVMKDKDGRLILIDYGHIVLLSDPYPYPLDSITSDKLVLKIEE